MRVVKPLVSAMPALFVSASGSVALADRRAALVVGNSTYAHIRNPENDATDMAAALRRIVFEVMTQFDTDRVALTTALRASTRRNAGAGRLAGVLRGPWHRDGRVNYLVPVDARLEPDVDARFEAVTRNGLGGAIDAPAGHRGMRRHVLSRLTVRCPPSIAPRAASCGGLVRPHR